MRKKNFNYSYYIHKIVKQTHPKLGITSGSLNVINSFILDIFNRIGNKAEELMKLLNRKTLLEKDISTSISLTFSCAPNILKYAHSEGIKAIENYKKNNSD